MDEVREKIKNLGSLQKKIVLWLGDMQGVTSISSLKKRWPSESTTYAPSRIAGIAETLQGLGALGTLGSRTVTNPTQYARYLDESYFYGEKILLDKGWTIWSPEKIMGHKPSAAESASISKGVRGLEDRGLLETEKVAGKKRRISHAKLTFYGEVASVLLRITVDKN